MRVSDLPVSRSGWWSIGLCGADILLFASLDAMFGPGPDYNVGLADTVTLLLTVISLFSLVLGLISILKSKARSVFVFLAAAVSLYSLVGEMAGGVTLLFGSPK